jgi:hypothetical protein
MICPICEKKIQCSIGGFCLKCIRAYGHDECLKMVIQKNKEKKEKEKLAEKPDEEKAG